jgi:hypothetical protein
MAVKLTFKILDGPQVDRVVEVTGPKCSVGGGGSGADIEVLGLPHGFKYVNFEQRGDRWNVSEFKPRTTLLNERHLKARNTLRNGHVLWLPSQVSGQSIRLELGLETVKTSAGPSRFSLGKLSPAVLLGGGAYLVVMLGAAAYFMAQPDPVRESAPLQFGEVRERIGSDIENATREEARRRPALSEMPTNFSELQSFLMSDISEQRKLELSEAFKQMVERHFSDAWRLEQQNRLGEARETYERVIVIMGRHDLETTRLALERLSRLPSN